MDFKTVLNGVLAMMLVFAVWLLAVRFFAPPPQPVPGQPPSQPDGRPDQAAAPVPNGERSVAGSRPSDETFEVAGGPSEGAETTLGAVEDRADRPYPMQLRLTSRGAGISEIRLSDYDAEVRRKDKPRLPYPLLNGLRDPAGGQFHPAMATESVTLFEGENVEGTSIRLDTIDWRLMERAPDAQVAEFEAVIQRNTPTPEPLLRLVKRYELKPQTREDGRHDVAFSLRFENLSDGPISFTARQLGPLGMKNEMLRINDRHIYAARKEGEAVRLTLNTHGDLAKRDISWPVDEPGKRLLWTAIDNQYFACILAPDAQGLTGFSDLVARVEATHVTNVQGAAGNGDMAPRLVLSRQTLQAGQQVTLALRCYFGPKSRPIFQDGEANPDYAQRKYVFLIERNYPWCTFAWLTNAMIVMLMFFGEKVFGNYGWGIIVLVLIVRTLLHPLTKKQQIGMTKMQKQMASLQPKLEEAKKKYANDKAKLNEEVMKVYREAGINPAGNLLTCLPMMLQMPIWAALWASLSSCIEMRHAPFHLWIRDLTAPDALVSFGPVDLPLLSWMVGPVTGLNILPILLGVSMYFQQRLMPKAAKAERAKTQTPDQLAQQRRMMNIMTVVFGVMFYNAPSGLTLYIMASNFFGIVEQWRIRRHLEEQERKGALAPVAGKSPGRRFSWLERLGELAEEVKKQPQREKRRRV